MTALRLNPRLSDSKADVSVAGLQAEDQNEDQGAPSGLKKTWALPRIWGSAPWDLGQAKWLTKTPLDPGQLLQGAGSMNLRLSSPSSESLVKPAHPYF